MTGKTPSFSRKILRQCLKLMSDCIFKTNSYIYQYSLLARPTKKKWISLSNIVSFCLLYISESPEAVGTNTKNHGLERIFQCERNVCLILIF